VTLTRRHLLGIGLGLGAGTLVGCSRTEGSTGELVRSAARLPERFTTALPRLQRLEPVRQGGRDVFEVTQRAADLEILPGVRTRALTYGGTFPGPLLETRSGREAVVRHTNRLDVPVSVHLHGGHTPAASDGYPTDLVHPGETREYHYPMRQRAATLWYHDHRMDFTGEQVYRGLVGMHLVRDDEEDALPLPRGDRELALVVVDRAFDADGQLAYPSRSGHPVGHGGHGESHGEGGADDGHVEGVLGDVMLVNGAPWPVVDVDAARYRLRILNGCNARRLDLVLDPPPPGGSSFVQVGSDGGLLEAPREHDHLTMAQAERLDVVVDFSAYPVGTRVRLRNRLGDGPTADVMRFDVARRGKDDSAPPERLGRLSTIEPYDTSGARVREWRLTRATGEDRPGWVINGRPFDPEEMHAEVPLGQVEVWRFFADMHHPVHVHLDPFQVIGRGGADPGDFDHGWKDTVDVRPAEHVDVAIRFDDYVGPFLMHCHNLEHEDRMMMAAFATV
jgi:spore coat protein A, manganese oxidase